MIARAIAIDSLKNLAANPLRSGLTMLGVIIGVASVIAMIAIVEGGQVWLVTSIERLGTNLLFVWNRGLNSKERQLLGGRPPRLHYSDALAIQQRFPELQVVPRLRLDKVLKVGDRDMSGKVRGTTPEYQEVRNFGAAVGRFLTATDLEEWRRVIVLGKEVAETLYGSESPLGKEIKVGEQRFTVIGVMEPKGIIYGDNYDEKVFIPITTAIRRFKGDDKISSIVIHVPRREDMARVSRQLKALLVQLHEGVEDIRVRSQEDFLSAVDRTIWTFRIVLGGIAVVALIVGGIGIMNIMLVTVTERTREIGLRKAIGARRRDILLQFLVESMAISIVGGLIGVGLGIFVAYGFGDFVAGAMPGGGDWGAVIRPSAIVVAFSFALCVGVFFGLYPAIKASKLDPAEALRYQ